MAGIRPRRWGWLTRMVFDLSRPRTVIVRPLRWAPALALLSVCLLAYPAFRASAPTGVASHAETALVTLAFALDQPDARSVALIGTFNDWNPEDHQMVRSRDDRMWTLRLQVPPGRYEYAFLVDGRHTVGDPHALFRRTDGFGAYNAIVFAESNAYESL